MGAIWHARLPCLSSASCVTAVDGVPASAESKQYLLLRSNLSLLHAPRHALRDGDRFSITTQQPLRLQRQSISSRVLTDPDLPPRLNQATYLPFVARPSYSDSDSHHAKRTALIHRHRGSTIYGTRIGLWPSPCLREQWLSSRPPLRRLHGPRRPALCRSRGTDGPLRGFLSC